MAFITFSNPLRNGKQTQVKLAALGHNLCQGRSGRVTKNVKLTRLGPLKMHGNHMILSLKNFKKFMHGFSFQIV